MFSFVVFLFDNSVTLHSNLTILNFLIYKTLSDRSLGHLLKRRPRHASLGWRMILTNLTSTSGTAMAMKSTSRQVQRWHWRTPFCLRSNHSNQWSVYTPAWKDLAHSRFMMYRGEVPLCRSWHWSISHHTTSVCAVVCQEIRFGNLHPKENQKACFYMLSTVWSSLFCWNFQERSSKQKVDCIRNSVMVNISPLISLSPCRTFTEICWVSMFQVHWKKTKNLNLTGRWQDF